MIEDGVQIGNFCRILHNTIISRNTIIGNYVTIGCNCTIGNISFGYEQNERGVYKPLSHIGKVIICDHTIIHNNAYIDQAVTGSTIIGEEVKIDNLVRIGYNGLVIVNSSINGSTEVGENCWISPSVSINNALKIANDNMIGTGFIVVKDTLPFSCVAAAPARDYGWKCRCHKSTLSFFTNGHAT